MRIAVSAAVLSLFVVACSFRPVATDPSSADADAAGLPDADGRPDAQEQPDAGLAPDASTPDAALPDASVPTDGCAGEVGEFYLERMNGLLKVMARCNGLVEEGVLAWYPTTESCAATVRAVAGGRIAFDRAQATACLALLRADKISCDEMPVSSGPCIDALAGRVPLGGACAESGECVEFGFCSASPLSCPGTCSARPGLGQPCPQLTCIEGAQCLGGTCHQIARVGEPCNDRRGPPCAADAWCNASGVCAPLKTSGSCQTSFECAAGYGCVRGTNGAQACTALKSPGQPCRVGAYECMTLSYCANGTCRVFPRLGEACPSGETQTSELAWCLDGDCRASKCVPFLEEGDFCRDSFQCGRSEAYSVCDPATNECVGPCKPRP